MIYPFKRHKLNHKAKRKRREEKMSDCEEKLEKLLEHEMIIESLTATSVLWKNWNNRLSTIIHQDPFKLDKEIRNLQNELKPLGVWSHRIGKYGSNWIRSNYLRFH